MRYLSYIDYITTAMDSALDVRFHAVFLLFSAVFC